MSPVRQGSQREKPVRQRLSEIGPIVCIYLQVPFKRQWPEKHSLLGQVAMMGSGMTGILAVVVLVGFLYFGSVWVQLVRMN